MLRNLGIISVLLLSSHSLVIAEQSADSSSLVCKNNKGTIKVWEDEGTCRCSVGTPDEDGYTYTNGVGAHKFFSEPKTWNQARKLCEKQGAHLAILDTDAERKALLQMFREQSGSISGKTDSKRHFWLGIHDQFEEGDWTTVLDDPLEYKPWAGAGQANCYYTQQPDNGGKQNCGTLVRDCDYMDDVQCEWALAFFCEKPVACS